MSYFRFFLVAGLLALLMGCDNPKFSTANGNDVAWDSYRGQWLLVNYWAEWCKPCLEEIPELNALDQSDDVTVLGVNYDGIEGQALLNLGSRMQIDYTLLAEDPGPALGWDLPVALPATFVVKPDGTLLEARFGPQTKQTLSALIHQ